MPVSRERWAPSPARSGLRDPLVYVVAAVALLVFAVHGFNGFLSRDLGIYAYAGQRVADGVPPYLGVLNRAGPLAHLLPGIGVVIARTVGVDDVLGLRLLFMVFAVAAVCMTYVLGRNLFRTPWAGVVAAASLTCLGGFIEYAADGPREKTPMVLLVVLSLWAMERRRWLLAGVFISLATLTLQIAFFALMPAAIVAVLVMPRGERVRSLVQVAFGGLVPVVVFGLLAAVTGSLSASVNAFLLINARYTVPQPITGDLPEAWASMIDGYGVTVWVVILGLAAMIVLGLMALRPATWRKDDSQPMVAALGIATLVGLVWSSRDFDGWGDVFPVLPMAALGFGGLAKVLVDTLPMRVSLALVGAWTALALLAGIVFSVTTRDDRLEVQRASVGAVTKELPSGSSIVSIQAPTPLVLSRRKNPTRYQMFSSGLSTYLDDTYPGGIDGFGRSIKRSRPTVIVIGKLRPPWIAGTLDSDYRQVGQAPGWTWFARKSLGPAELDRIHMANRRAVLAAQR
jgi:Dolichyl-phosphate-mannose-protein mannosyltransferase